MIDRNTSMLDAFVTADDVLRQAIQGISDLILVPGPDQPRLRRRQDDHVGHGRGDDGHGDRPKARTRAIDAANRAISSPLLEDASVNGARGVIINVTGGPDMSLMEVNEALTIIQEAAHEDANIIFGAVVDPTLKGKVKITVIATGFDHVRTDRSTPADGADADAGGHDGLLVAGARERARPVRGAAARHDRAAPVARDAARDAPKAVAVGQTGSADMPLATPTLPGEFDLNLDLDVPAFLRRSEG